MLVLAQDLKSPILKCLSSLKSSFIKTVAQDLKDLKSHIAIRFLGVSDLCTDALVPCIYMLTKPGARRLKPARAWFLDNLITFVRTSVCMCVHPSGY